MKNNFARITKETLREAEAFLRCCKHLGPVVEEHGACTLNPSGNDPFDTLVTSIISQQISIKAADSIERRVRKLTGNPHSPEKILALSQATLKACGLSSRKVEYITGIAQAVQSRALNFETLDRLDDRSVIRELCKLHGVGQWTAEMLMIFALGRMDIFSVRDIGLQRGMKHLFGDKASTLSAMEKIAERWRPYRSIASWYLWKIVD